MKRIAALVWLAWLSGCIDVDRSGALPDTGPDVVSDPGSDGDPADSADDPDADAAGADGQGDVDRDSAEDTEASDSGVDGDDTLEAPLGPCAPCDSQEACAPSGLVCVSYGDAGSFCAAACETDDCDAGYACQPVDVVGHDGPPASHCVALAECTCSPAATAAAAATTCWNGACAGSRHCDLEGLTACDAPPPADETCNGHDDDCNGLTDEVCEPPAAPILTHTLPGSPASDTTPTLFGTAGPEQPVRVYIDFACEGPPAFEDVTSASGAFDLVLTVPADVPVAIYAEVLSEHDVASACAGPLEYLADTTPPAPPTLAGTNPASPTASPVVSVSGTAEPSAEVELFADAACAGAPVSASVAGDDGAFAFAGVAVALNADTVFSARASDAAGNVSDCTSSGLVLVHDSVAPPPPVVFALTPEASSSSAETTVTVVAEGLATVDLHTSPQCSGAPLASAEADFFGTATFVVTANQLVTTFYAAARDGAGNLSSCSSQGLTFVFDQVAPSFNGLFGAAALTPESVVLTLPTPIDDHYPVDALALEVCWGLTPAYCSEVFTVKAAMPFTDTPVVSGLAPNTRYHFAVRVADPLGNVSAPSKILSVTTPSHRVAVGIDVGGASSCALLVDGSLRCWGAGEAGQLGGGGFAGSPVPLPVPTLAAVAVGVGDAHACALRSDGTVACWGDNSAAQLGLGITEPARASPVTVAYADAAVGLAVGDAHTCILKASGGVSCWGDNGGGQLGAAPGPPSATLVNAVASGARAVVAGGEHTCALGGDGLVKCWGANTYGQLGSGSATPVSGPVVVSSAKGLTVSRAVAAGRQHTCAIRSDGQLFCWGDNTAGQLGASPATVKYTGEPLAHPTITQARAVALGDAFTCALLMSGKVVCWGDNTSGQLGSKSAGVGSVAPVEVTLPGPAVARALTAGPAHACAILGDGATVCWGAAADGRLGVGALDDASTLLPTVLTGVHGPSRPMQVAAGREATCAVTPLGEVHCWGTTLGQAVDDGVVPVTPSPAPVAGLELAVTVDVGAQHACALLATGKLRCWGLNGAGQLGDGTTSPRSAPVEPGLPILALGLGLGETHSCAFGGAGQLYCWGDNDAGKLGTGNLFTQHSPTAAIQVPPGLTAISGGLNHTCGLYADGKVRCWGANGLSQLGATASFGSLQPVEVAVSGVVELAVGYQFNCVRTTAGGVRCWGANDARQLGTDAVALFGIATPVVVPLLAPTDLDAGDRHACALGLDGEVRCWGDNTQAQLGTGTTTPANTEVPQAAALAQASRAVWTGAAHTCAARAADGRLTCWGDNSMGQVGSGTPSDFVATPFLLPGPH